jgi:hypothetical protein
MKSELQERYYGPLYNQCGKFATKKEAASKKLVSKRSRVSL